MEGWSGTAASPELASGLLPRKMKETFLTRKRQSKRAREQAGTYQMHKTKSCPGCYLRFRDLHRLFSRGIPPARNKKPHLTSKKCQCAPIMMWNCSNTVLGPCKSASSMASADLFFSILVKAGVGQATKGSAATKALPNCWSWISILQPGWGPRTGAVLPQISSSVWVPWSLQSGMRMGSSWVHHLSRWKVSWRNSVNIFQYKLVHSNMS